MILFIIFFFENTITWGNSAGQLLWTESSFALGRMGMASFFCVQNGWFVYIFWFCWQKWASKISVLLRLEVMGAWPGTGCPLVCCCPQPVLCGPRVPSTDAEPCDWCRLFNLYLN